VFAALLHEEDARRATETLGAVLAHGLRCALTGGLAIAAQLRAHGRPVERRRLNDTRAAPLDEETGALHVLSVEDLVARTTALVCGSLRRRNTIDAKHATAFTRLQGLGRPEQLAAAWSDHRQRVPGTLADATRETIQLLETYPELVVAEKYSTLVTPCERCREQGPFRSAPADRIVRTLGYW
jgi:thioesterase domain-containing protein